MYNETIMEKLHFSITIDAPKEKVWNAMLDDATYRIWTEAFSPGSYYEGKWEKGVTIRFLAPSKDGGPEGMLSRVNEITPPTFVSIEHLGIIAGGKEDTENNEVRAWQGALENYMLREAGGKTEVLIDMDAEDAYKGMFTYVWPMALARLKDLAEGRRPNAIIVGTDVNAPIERVWECWTKPEHIVGWAFASDDWETLAAENDLRVGGKFKTVMAAKDKSAQFDVTGVYTAIHTHTFIACDLDDGRHVDTVFAATPYGVHMIQSFAPETENTRDVQRAGWQAILDNFKRYTEVNTSHKRMMEITETSFAPRTYLMKRQEINIKDIMDQQMWQTRFEKVHEYIKKNDLTIVGPGSTLYFSMDEATGITDFGIGNAVEGATEPSDPELSMVPVPASKAAVGTVLGDYTELKDAHRQMRQYCEERGITRRMPVIEEYAVTAMDTPDPKDWKTNIYYLYE